MEDQSDGPAQGVASGLGPPIRPGSVRKDSSALDEQRSHQFYRANMRHVTILPVRGKNKRAEGSAWEVQGDTVNSVGIRSDARIRELTLTSSELWVDVPATMYGWTSKIEEILGDCSRTRSRADETPECAGKSAESGLLLCWFFCVTVHLSALVSVLRACALTQLCTLFGWYHFLGA